MRILVACEFSGIVRDAFRRRGHEAWSNDLENVEPEGEWPNYHLYGSCLDMIDSYGPWDMLIAFPPCTRLANSGVRWLTTPPRGKTLAQMWIEFNKGVELYLALRNAPIPKKVIENPVMNPYAHAALGNALRQIIQPHYFGDPFFKATGFELINVLPLQRTHYMELPKKGTPEHKKWSAVHRASPGQNRGKERSRMTPGIAIAMAAQWG